MKQRLASLLLISLTLPILAQAPKTLKLVKSATYTVQTYDAEGNTLHTGNGFFAPGGDFITSYALFPGCAKAEIIDNKGRAFAINKVLGANEIYDIIRLQTAPVKKPTAAPIDTAAMDTRAESLFLPAIGKEKKVYDTWVPIANTEQVAGGYTYYTLRHRGNEALSHRPLLTWPSPAVSQSKPSSSGAAQVQAVSPKRKQGGTSSRP